MSEEEKKDESQGDESKKDDSQGDKSSKTDWTKIDLSEIPEDLIKKHPAYKTVLDESVNRRKEIKTLKDEMKKLGQEEEAKEDKKEPVKKEDEEVPAWAKQILEKFNTQEQETVASWRKDAGAEYGLKGSAIDRLQGKTKDEIFTDAKKLADELGIPKPTQNNRSNSTIGNPVKQRDKSIVDAAKAILRNEGGSNPFDPELQKSMGGGIYMKE